MSRASGHQFRWVPQEFYAVENSITPTSTFVQVLWEIPESDPEKPNEPPSVAEMLIDRIRGQVCVRGTAESAIALVGIGILKSRNVPGFGYSAADPLDVGGDGDAGIPEWVYTRAFYLSCTNIAGKQDETIYNADIDLAVNIKLGVGRALQLITSASLVEVESTAPNVCVAGCLKARVIF